AAARQTGDEDGAGDRFGQDARIGSLRRLQAKQVRQETYDVPLRGGPSDQAQRRFGVACRQEAAERADKGGFAEIGQAGPPAREADQGINREGPIEQAAGTCQRVRGPQRQSLDRQGQVPSLSAFTVTALRPGCWPDRVAAIWHKHVMWRISAMRACQASTPMYLYGFGSIVSSPQNLPPPVPRPRSEQCADLGLAPQGPNFCCKDL